MEGRIKFAFLSEDSKNKNTPIPVVLMNCKVKAGDHVVNKHGLSATVNQSTQIFYDENKLEIGICDQGSDKTQFYFDGARIRHWSNDNQTPKRRPRF